jgi:hypothetical protein
MVSDSDAFYRMRWVVLVGLMMMKLPSFRFGSRKGKSGFRRSAVRN